MIVRSAECKKRTFKGIDFLVGATGERMMVTLMIFKKGQTAETHSHPNEQSGYCFRGRFALTVDNETSIVGPGDSYVIPAGAPHSYEILEDSLAVEVFSPPREDYR